MTTRNRMRPIHPGEILREEFLVPLDMSGNRLALSLRVPATRITAILNGERGLTADTALRLGRFFGTTPDFWMNLQKTFELRTAEEAIGATVERDVQPHARARKVG